MEPDKAVEAQVQGEFDEMEQQLANANPGVLDILQVYGDCEAAVRQADEYLAVVRPRPVLVTSDRSIL